MSGDCPDDGGFKLNEYSDVSDIRARLDRYDRNNLPGLVSKAASTAFTEASGGRQQATKIAVIFLGTAKVSLCVCVCGGGGGGWRVIVCVFVVLFVCCILLLVIRHTYITFLAYTPC